MFHSFKSVSLVVRKIQNVGDRWFKTLKENKKNVQLQILVLKWAELNNNFEIFDSLFAKAYFKLNFNKLRTKISVSHV